MAIKHIGFRAGFNGKLILRVTEDYDHGEDWRGAPNSLSRTRTRDAVPNDLIELTREGFIITEKGGGT